MATKGAVGFQGPIGLPDVIDQSPEDGFTQPPTTYTHPTAFNVAKPPTANQYPAGTIAPTSAYTSLPLDNTGPAPAISGMLTPWNQEGITPPKGTAPTDPQFGVSQEQIVAMQASQRAMTILQVAPSLKTHPDIVAALAYNTNVPFTPETIKMIAVIQRARSAIDYSAKFTMEDYNQTAHLVDPQAFAHESMPARIGRGLNMEGNWFNNTFAGAREVEGALSWLFGGTASNIATLSSSIKEGLRNSPIVNATDIPSQSIGTSPSGGTLATTGANLPSIVPGAKPLVNFVADQFDTPEHLYRYIATVQHKYGTGMAALALLPTIAGALVGTALGGIGGAKGAELALAAEEALTNSFINEGLSDLAAATLAKRDLSLLEERASVLLAQRAAKVGNVAGQLGRIVTTPINVAAKVATSPISLGADVGFTGGGQVLFRQDYMDSRDSTTWAEKYPMLASTFGRYATQGMPDGGWKTILSGSLDAIAAVAVPDAIGSVGRVVGTARSAEGFTGGLLSGKYKDTGNWFGNVYDKYGGISRTPDGKLKVGGVYKTGLRLSNIDAAYNESKAARQTVNLIAQMGSAGAIMAVDARFAPIADLLAKARVLNADGTVNMTKSVENVKQVLRDSQTAAELMERPLAMSSIPLTANGIYQELGKAITKANALTGHMFSPLPLYASQKTLRMENRVFTIGDRDALPAIRDMIGVQYGYGVADQVVNELASNLDPHFWQQTIVNGIAGEMAASVAKAVHNLKIPKNIADEILKEYDKIIPDKLRQIFNFGGPGNRGAYGYGVYVGEEGIGSRVDLSRVQERTQKASDEAISESVLSQASKYGMTEEEFAATGETLHHGTIAKFDGPFDPAKAGYRGEGKSGGSKNGGFYFSDEPTVAAKYGSNRLVDSITPSEIDNFTNNEELITAALGKDQKDLSNWRVMGDDGQWTPAKLSDITLENYKNSTIGRVNFPNARIITTKVYGKTIDLRPPTKGIDLTKEDQAANKAWFNSLPDHVQKWLINKFEDSGPSAIAKKLFDYSYRYKHERDKKFAALLEQSAKLGYGKIRVFDSAAESGGQSIVAHPDYIAYGQDPIAKYGESGVKGPADVSEELFGGNHNLTDVTRSLTEGTMASAIVPEEIGKMHLPSYLELDRVQKQFAKMMKERYESAINVKPDIAELTVHIDELNTRLASASDPETIDKIEKQISKAEAQLAIKKEIGASVPKKMPNFGYGVFKKGLAGASNTYDFIDHYYNNLIFKRLALATGGWAMRTGMSEASLNIFRQGPLNYTAGRLAASVARHERAVLHVGKKFTRKAAEDIAARIYYLAKEDGLLGPNGAVFKNEEEMQAAVANVRKIANEANYYFKISNEQIAKALRAEEKDAMRLRPTIAKTSAAYRGFMVGAKSQIIKQLNKQDLLDAAIRLMYMNDGHIVSPMLNATHAGIANDMQVGSDTADNINVAAWRNPFITNNGKLQKAKFSKDFQAIEPGPRYASSLHTRSEWMLGSKIYAPTFAAYYEEYAKAKETLLASGATLKEASSQAAEIASMEIRPKVKEWLDTRLTDNEKKALFRTTHPLPMETSIYASKLNSKYSGLSDEAHAALSDQEHAAVDHITAVIKSAEGHVRFNNGTINEPLLHAMAYNEIPSDLGDFKRQMMTIKGKAIDDGMFNAIPGPELDYANYGVAEQFLNKFPGSVTNLIHKKALGPIVNRLTRDPIYIVDFAAERKLLNPKVEAGELTRDQADTMAQARASVNAMKYIHNPKNKLKFENMMRLWAPFYFAENQAWRRLGRLAWTNPGAAEQYTKAMYQTQEAIYNYDQNTGNIGIPIPGSAWLNKHWFFGVAMPFELSPNSLRTVFPWSAEGGEAPGVGSLISSFLPKVGPIMSLPANLYLQKEAGMLPEVDKFLSKYVVGQAGLGQPLILSMIPNSILVNLAKMGIGYLAADDKSELVQNVLGVTSSSYIAANTMVTTALLDAKQQEAWNRHKNDALPSDWAAAGATQHEYALYRMADDIEKQFKSPADRQAFLDAANTKTLEIFALKTALSASSPMSVMLGRADLQYSKEFQAEIDSTGSVLEAANSFLAKHPDLTAETLFTTKATGGGAGALGVAWPTSPGTADFMLKHKDDIINYPAAMRFALQEGKDTKDKKGYDQMAHFLQTSWSLRAQQTPTGFLNSYLETVFNQFHYGVLQPWGQELVKRGYSVNEVNNILLHNKTTWESRKNDPSKWSVLEQFGKNVAPLAFHNYIAGESSNNRADALQQLREVIAMPEMLAKYENFRDIANILMPAADQLIAYKQQAAKSGDTAWRDNLALQWNSELDRVAAAKPDLLPVIQQIFRPLAPIFTN